LGPVSPMLAGWAYR